MGVGVAAKKHHDDKEGMQSWLEDARYRTQAYRNGQGSGPVAWVLSEGRDIPQDAIAAGHDSNVGTLFIARGFHRGSNSEFEQYLSSGLHVLTDLQHQERRPAT